MEVVLVDDSGRTYCLWIVDDCGILSLASVVGIGVVVCSKVDCFSYKSEK